MSAATFLAGTDVNLTVPLQDSDGNALVVDSIQYRVTDGTGNELVPLSALASFVAEATEAVILVPAAQNTLSGSARDMRDVELHLAIAGNTVVLHSVYVIELANGLSVGVNTFQTLEQAEFLAQTMPNLAGWNGATRADRISALIEARLHICRLSFMPLNSARLWGQDTLNYIPEGQYNTPYVSSEMSLIWGGDLSFLTADQFNKLPAVMLGDLNLAQVAEANAILGGDPEYDKRRSGVMLDTVGESKTMFRSAKPLDLPVCRRAASYVSRWITFAKRIARG